MQLYLRLFACLIPALLLACGGKLDSLVPTTRQASRAANAGAPAPLTAAAYHDVVQRFYVAYFGRPADVSGLDFWSGQYHSLGLPLTVSGFADAYASDATVRHFVDVFGGSAESLALYPGDNNAFVDAVYRNLFSRFPDAVGKAFWVGALDRGAITRPVAAFSIMRGAQSTDIAIIENKVAVAKAFTAVLTTDARRDAYDGMAAAATARAMLGKVGLDTDAGAFGGVAAALAELLARLGPAQRFLDFGSVERGSTAERLHLQPTSGGNAIEMAPAGVKQAAGTLFSAPLQDGAAVSVTPDSALFWKYKRLYRQPLTGHGNIPQATIVSSLTADDICLSVPGESFNDLNDARQSWRFFRRPGPDLNCFGDAPLYAAVRMDMSNTSAAVASKEPLFAIRTPTGAISGFLVRDGLAVQRVDAGLGNAVTMFTSFDDFDSVADVPQVVNMFFFRLRFGSTVYAWDGDSTAPGDPTVLNDSESGSSIGNFLGNDPERIYFTARSMDQVKVRVLPLSNKVPATIGVLPVTGENQITFNVTAKHFVVGKVYGGGIWVLPRAGGLARQVYTPPNSWYTERVDVAGERIWFHTLAGLSSINTDGSGLATIAGGTRVGCVYRTGILFAAENDACDAMLVLENDTLRGYNARTGALEVTYGALGKSFLSGADFVEANRSRGSNGQRMIVTFHSSSPVTGLPYERVDWHFVAGQPGLSRITTP